MTRGIKSVIEDTFRAAEASVARNLTNPEFIQKIEQAAHLLAGSQNRILTCGMGKSGIIARKVAATLTSTGSPAVFLHPADALHGDLGNLQSREVVLAFSNSGETRELVELLPHIRRLQGKLVAVTQKADSTLAREADCAVIYTIAREGCPLDLAPMASTTISLIIGDAIAAALIKIKKFRREDFGKYHPSGTLGRKLLTRVRDVMQPVEPILVTRNVVFRDFLPRMIAANLGCIVIVGSKGHLRGIITDGDIKRLLEQFAAQPERLFTATAGEIMTPNPHSIRDMALVDEAFAMMQEKKTYMLPVVNARKKPIGLVRMHDLIKVGG
ncbi:MAG: KpsF/GutQ family sugar-phosphate isomerase [Leptospiraceae bacterium]|nr:KpsF/GutQ family sugar-phosphate isomerase [Leptospiraceae bacterium]